MSAIAAEKDIVLHAIIRAKKAVEDALTCPRGMSVVEFHDLRHLKNIFEEMLKERGK